MKLFKILWLTTALVSYDVSLAQDNTEQNSAFQLQIDQKRFISDFIKTTPSRGTRAQRREAADFLIKELENAGLPAQRHRYEYPNIHFLLDLVVPPFRGQNIISTIPATRPSDEYIVIGAHYDSVLESPGAGDNASGVAVIFSLAQSLSSLNERGINFSIVFFDHEEDGSSGSKAYLRKLQKEGISIMSMHNVDMIGWDGDKDRAIDAEFPTNEMADTYRSAANKRGVEITSVTYNSSDHIPFREAGFETVCLSEEYVSGDSTPHYHKPTDSIDTLDFEYLASTTQILTDVMVSLARQD